MRKSGRSNYPECLDCSLTNEWGKVRGLCSQCFKTVWVMASEEKDYVCGGCERRNLLSKNEKTDKLIGLALLPDDSACAMCGSKKDLMVLDVGEIPETDYRIGCKKCYDEVRKDSRERSE